MMDNNDNDLTLRVLESNKLVSIMAIAKTKIETTNFKITICSIFLSGWNFLKDMMRLYIYISSATTYAIDWRWKGAYEDFS